MGWGGGMKVETRERKEFPLRFVGHLHDYGMCTRLQHLRTSAACAADAAAAHAAAVLLVAHLNRQVPAAQAVAGD